LILLDCRSIIKKISSLLAFDGEWAPLLWRSVFAEMIYPFIEWFEAAISQNPWLRITAIEKGVSL